VFIVAIGTRFQIKQINSLLAIILLLADVSPTYSIGLPQGSELPQGKNKNTMQYFDLWRLQTSSTTGLGAGICKACATRLQDISA